MYLQGSRVELLPPTCKVGILTVKLTSLLLYVSTTRYRCSILQVSYIYLKDIEAISNSGAYYIRGRHFRY